MSGNNGGFSAREAAQLIYHQRSLITPTNTKRAYVEKGLEFLQFCDFEYKQEREFRRTINSDKLYKFLLFVAYRGKRQRGKKRTSGGDEKVFDEEEYKAVMDRIGDLIKNRSSDCPPGNDELEAAATSATTGHGVELLGFSQLNIYKCAVQRLHGEQYDNGANRKTWDEIYTQRCKELLKLVKLRKPSEDRKHFKEKVDHTFLPYQVATEKPRLEEALWKRNAMHCLEISTGALRDRFVFLFTNGGLLRGESLFKAELSDFMDFKYKSKYDPTPYHTLIMKFVEGKVNRGKTFFGRALRHRNAELCSLGALGMYLLARFEATGEKFDFKSNENWFRVMLLVDTNSSRLENKVAVSDRCYAKTMKAVCRQLGINSSHWIHLGRVTGPVELEMNEVEKSVIESLGYWNQTIYDQSYSTCLPLSGMRVMAGYPKEVGTHFNPRMTYDVPPQLQQRIWPWLEAAKEDVRRNASNSSTLVTAQAFLTLLTNLRPVILQDVAVLMARGRDHKLFKLPVFQSDAFKEFQSGLLHHIENEESTAPDMVVVRRLVPLIAHHLQQNNTLAQRRHQELMSELSFIKTNMVTEQRMKEYHDRAAQYWNGNAPAEAVQTPQEPNQVEAESEEVENGSNLLLSWRPAKEFGSIKAVVDEWSGNSGSTFPLEGGIEKMEKEHLNKWRSHWEKHETKRLSRMRTIIRFLDKARATSERGMEVVEAMFRHKNSKLGSFNSFIGKPANWDALIAEWVLKTELGQAQNVMQSASV